VFVSMTRQRKRSRALPAINVAPLIDIVFILLIFFLVTTTFVRDHGLDITRPQAAVTQVLEPTASRVHITEDGRIFSEGDEVALEQLSDRVRALAAQTRDPVVVVVPDEATPAGLLLEVLDTLKLAGIDNTSVATRERQRP